jgi:hypothetical protein
MKNDTINSNFILINAILVISLIFGGDEISLFATAWTTSTLHSCRLSLSSQSLLSSSSWQRKRYCHKLHYNSKHTLDNNEPEIDTPIPTSTTIFETKPINSATASSTILPQELIQSLDLIPLLEEVAKYTSTKRGRNAILSLLGNNYNVKSPTQQNQQGRIYNNYNHNPLLSKRKSILSSFTTNTDSKDYYDNPKKYEQVFKLSQSITECKEEWELIREATNILHLYKYNHKNENNSPTNHENEKSKRHNMKNDEEEDDDGGDIHLPPIYPENSSLWNTYHDQVDTDDDEWLMEILNGGGGGGGKSFPSLSSSSLELENILQADQLIKRILKTHEWCIDLKSRDIAPMIAKHFCARHIDIEKLIHIHDEIQGRVIIKKGGISYQDPEGTKVSNYS